MTDELLRFDLQLFNELNGQPETDPTAPEGAGEPEEVDFDFAIDEHGNVVFRDDGEEDPDGQPPEPEAPATYKVKVDGQEVDVPIEELLSGYQRQADYTRKTQEVAAMRKQYEDQMAVLNQPQQPIQPQAPVPAEPQKVDLKQYYEQLANYAKARVEKNLEIVYDELNPMHQAAMADEIANVKVQVVQQQQAQNALNNVMGKYSADPEWQAIDKYALDRLNNMPYAQAVQVKARLEGMDIGFIDQYLNAVRTEYYTARNQTAPVPQVAQPTPAAPKPMVKPPFVERGGAAQEADKPAMKVDYKALGRMTVDQQAEVFRRLGLTNL